MEARTKEIGLWYNVLLSWPVFVLCFWVNAIWGPRISRRAQTMLHPTYRHQPSPASTPIRSRPAPSPTNGILANVFSSVARILLISDFTLVSRLIGLLPGVGKLGAFAYMCVVDSYYCFEWNFSMKQWPLEYRITYIQDRLAYMFGFGLPATLMTSFGPPLVTMAIFALIYPLFVIQALQSRPPTRQSSLLPSTPTGSIPPSPGAYSPGPSPTAGFTFPPPSSPAFSLAKLVNVRPRLPLFWFARHALEGLKWLEEAVGRDRSGSGKGVVGLGIRERPGKRLM
ncbi:etoposide-induced protein [Cryptococcus wingfieldii CBS 7118]|uniref:Etoposide-induced protein n=1 Tax=Cryptococcus wingfieldii CBS 7118 TaxID=1295528 RepID=A0A1E3K6N0_9TREE|nr:etoposide-induced protein [Cryptococcus wingfieldii CBS 7118]ODO08800.1 etoposide-induced protein [Cryptococcus wingfieldii CBS 7118]